MALPRIDAPEYDLTLHNGETIKYRPFLVKEQKILLLSLEEKDQKHVLNAMKRIISNCTFEKVNVEELPIFEVENLFLRLREKSVGEQIELRMKCIDEECGGLTPVTLDLSDIKIDYTKIPDTKIKISESIVVNMKFPTMSNLEEVQNLENVEDNFKFLSSCIKNIEAGEDVYDVSTTSKEEMMQFVESMTATQFNMIRDFFLNLPKLEKTIEYTCVKCGKKQSRTIQGIQSFLV